MTNEFLPVDGCEKSSNSCTTMKYAHCNTDKLYEEPHHMEVQRNMPAPGPAPLASFLLPGEHKDIRIDIGELLTDSSAWLTTPNASFRGRRPLDLIGTSDEQLLRDALRSAVYSGMA